MAKKTKKKVEPKIVTPKVPVGPTVAELSLENKMLERAIKKNIAEQKALVARFCKLVDALSKSKSVKGI